MALALVVLAVCSFAPGFYFVRRLRWDGLEKLCGSVALSILFLWLAAWAVYVFAPAAETPAYLTTTGVCVAAAWAARRDAAAVFRGVRVRRALTGYGFLLLWALLLLTIIRNYSGGRWRGDWLEHFQRSLFFLHHFSPNIPIFGGYQLPARPPAMNVLAAFVMAQAGERFEVFQATFTFFNLLLFLPCAMALPMLARPRRPGVLPLAAIFAASPIIIQNATYTWTKSLAAFFVILAILFYLKAWRKQDPLRMTAAFLALAMGLLVHYSAGPYIVFLAAHLLLRRPKFRELAAVAGLSAAMLATWFAWSITTYGVRTTFMSNTSVTTSQSYRGHNLEKIGGNLADSTIPIVLRDPSAARDLQQPNVWGTLRDFAFVVYQQNLVFCMGALGGFAVLWLVAGTLRKRFGQPGERAFWAGLIAWSVAVGIAVVGEGDPLGVAHLTLVPMAVIGMTLLAARFAMSRVLACVVILGCLVDFSLGVFLQARIEHLENTPERQVFPGLVFAGGQFEPAPPGEDSLSAGAWDNWMHKHEYALAREWGGVVENTPAPEAAKTDARRKLLNMTTADSKFWGGWYRRNDGEVMFLGDWFGGSNFSSAVLLLLFTALMWTLARAIPKATAKAAPAPIRVRKRRRK